MTPREGRRKQKKTAGIRNNRENRQLFCLLKEYGENKNHLNSSLYNVYSAKNCVFLALMLL